VFCKADEDELAQHFLRASKLHYGLSNKLARNLAYNFAEANGKSRPKSWDMNNCAGRDWLYGFMKRRPELALRSPEATNFARV